MSRGPKPTSLEDDVTVVDPATRQRPTVRKRLGWAEARELFALGGQGTWLNTAAIGPVPRPVLEVGQALLGELHAELGAFEDRIGARLQAARAAVAAFIGGEADDIAFVGSSSAAMSLLALRLKRLERQRDAIVTLRDEFPATTLPFKRQGFTLRFTRPAADGSYALGEILRQVGRETAAVVVSHVQFRTGARLDLAPLAAALAEQRVPLIVNATQSAGVLPLDARKLRLSALCFSSHKWLLAGPGGAVLWLPAAWRDEGFPPLAGWLSARDPLSFVNHRLFIEKSARSLEQGGISLVPPLMLAESLRLFERLGAVAVRDRVLDLTDRLIEGFAARGARLATPRPREQRAGIVSVMRPDAAAWIERLGQANIRVSQRGPDLVRVAAHFFNTEDEIDRLLALW